MDNNFWLLLLCKALLAILVGLIGFFVGLPLLLAEITRQRNNYNKHQVPASSLYVGRVWHTRLVPKKHAFDYPLFVFALDLEENQDLFAVKLWPLSLLVKFRDLDHLKNGEGLLGTNGTKPNHDKKQQHVLARRVLRLVAQKTKSQFLPTLQTHRVMIMTHLCYYGYCFNPVSFYYLQDKATNQLAAVVAEVSNTPWNEMHCYVLHKDSTDEVQVKELKRQQKDQDVQAINYVFPKRFHVSPFMEMNYLYDWTMYNFQLQRQQQEQKQQQQQTENNLSDVATTSLKVSASMKRDNQIHFTAKVEVFRKGMHPYTIAWQMIYYPIYCFIIQLWIHYEAFLLFVKGIVFVPHPNDAETTVSRAIAAVMTPLFAFKDWLSTQFVSSSRSAPSSVSSQNGDETLAPMKKAKTS